MEKGKAIPKKGKGKATQGQKGKGKTRRMTFEAYSHQAMDTARTHEGNKIVPGWGKALAVLSLPSTFDFGQPHEDNPVRTEES